MYILIPFIWSSRRSKTSLHWKKKNGYREPGIDLELGFSRETETTGYWEREKEKKICYKELVHAIMKALQAHSLFSASLRPRKTTGVVQSVSKGLNQSGWWYKINPSLSAGGEWYTSSGSKTVTSWILSSSIFYSGPQ